MGPILFILGIIIVSGIMIINIERGLDKIKIVLGIKKASPLALYYSILKTSYERHRSESHFLEGCVWCYMNSESQEKFWSDLNNEKLKEGY